MPCDSVAVASARLTPETAREILANKALQNLLLKKLAEVTPARPIEIRQSSPTYLSISAGRNIEVVVTPSGIRAESPFFGRQELASLTGAVSEEADRLALKLTIARGVKAIQTRFLGVQDQGIVESIENGQTVRERLLTFNV